MAGTNVTYEGKWGYWLGNRRANGSPLSISFNGLATSDANPGQQLHRITYFNAAGDRPTPGLRTIELTLTDGDGGTSSASR
ncbi:MAG: hypothetical protein R3C99_18530 [Pirellulaceae bacterium]